MRGGVWKPPHPVCGAAGARAVRYGNLNGEGGGSPKAAGPGKRRQTCAAGSGAGQRRCTHRPPGRNSRRPSGGSPTSNTSPRGNLPLKKHALPRPSDCQLPVRGSGRTSLLVKERRPTLPPKRPAAGASDGQVVLQSLSSGVSFTQDSSGHLKKNSDEKAASFISGYIHARENDEPNITA